MARFKLAASLMLIASSNVFAFTLPGVKSLSFARRAATAKSTTLQMSQNLVVISPPGGVGEVAAVHAAKMGSSVRWFVISPTSSNGASLSGPVMDSIAASGKDGSIELAGAQAENLLVPKGEEGSAIAAVSAWCGSDADAGVICVYDGVDEAIEAANNVLGTKPMDGGEIFKLKNAMEDAIKVAAKEASTGISSGIKVAVLPFDVEFDGDDENNDGSGFLGSLLGGNKVQVPSSLNTAMGPKNVATLRYGELFGTPESSPDASPLLGGPRKYPVLRDEYTMRAIRIDPSISVSGNTMMGDNSRSSRLSVGEAAVRMATKSDGVDGMDVCITSLSGIDAHDDEEWAEDFARVQKAMKENGGAELFSTAFGSVPNLDRLADWLATKWAPAVLKTYDIAGIRVGARPVYASRTGNNGVEIVWQELKDFKTLVVGKMVIEVSNEGITARRAAGDASVGFGTISKKPLAGEDILVRRLSDAAVQAMEKGLATKPAPVKRKKKVEKVAPVVNTVVSTGAVETPAAAAPKTMPDSGPRTSGARRSSERVRGKRRTRTPTSDNDSSEGFQ